MRRSGRLAKAHAVPTFPFTVSLRSLFRPNGPTALARGEAKRNPWCLRQNRNVTVFIIP
jgi:hypothetical protein